MKLESVLVRVGRWIGFQHGVALSPIVNASIVDHEIGKGNTCEERRFGKEMDRVVRGVTMVCRFCLPRISFLESGLRITGRNHDVDQVVIEREIVVSSPSRYSKLSSVISSLLLCGTDFFYLQLGAYPLPPI